MLYSFFWVFPRLLNFIRRRFGILYSIFIGSVLTQAMKMGQCSETSPYKIQTSGNHQKERIQNFIYSYSLMYMFSLSSFTNECFLIPIVCSIEGNICCFLGLYYVHEDIIMHLRDKRHVICVTEVYKSFKFDNVTVSWSQ
jgi:hypothetical protein